MTMRILPGLVALSLVALPHVARADGPPPPAAAAARETFAAAAADMRRIEGEIAVLEAKWQQPGADREALARQGETLMAQGLPCARKLEAAAIGLLRVDPRNAEAREICGAAVAGALRRDDPLRALDGTTALVEAQAADSGVLLMAATAAMILSRLDEAQSWLEKARVAGAPARQVAELEKVITSSRATVEAEMSRRKAEAAADDLPRVLLQTTAGDIVVELFEDDAPNTVANFVSLVKRGFYDGTAFHRVIGGFMAQGGDPTGTGGGGPGYCIACESDAPTARKHFFATLSMAHAGPDTGGSQFFLTFAPTSHLDGKHTVFGRVVEGFDVLPLLRRTQDAEGRPIAGLEPDKIEKATVLRARSHPYEPEKLPDRQR